jgi:hypothetical protein
VRKNQSRICLVLDCDSPHDFCPKYTKLVNLQHYVTREKRVPEPITNKIFFSVVQIVERLHKVQLKLVQWHGRKQDMRFEIINCIVDLLPLF